jgi:hypothetical protein
MTLTKSVSVSLHGAMLLARGQTGGLLFLQADPRGLFRCFWAIGMALPTVLYLATLDWPAAIRPAAALSDLLRQALIFVAAWLGFIALTHAIAPLVRRQHLWAPMIVVWSWCNIPESMLTLLGSVPGSLGAPHAIDQFAQVATFGWALWIEWFAFRLAFRAGPLLAIWLVMVDQSIGVLLVVLDRMITGH